MKARLLPIIALATMLLFPVFSHAGIAVSSPGTINGYFYIYYGLGSPAPGKVAYVSVTKPNGSNYTVAQAENVPDYSQVCWVQADVAGLYRFFYEYSFYAQGIGRTVVFYQDYYIQPPQNNIQWNSYSTSPPTVAAPAQNVTIAVQYTNTGGTYWDGNYYIEFKDPYGTPLYYASVAGTSPNVSGTRSTNVTLPNLGGLGTASYQVRGMQHNVQFFGPVLTVPIWVDYPPTTALSVSSASVAAGQSVTVTSVTSDIYLNVINQAIDYIAPGQSTWVSGSGGAGTRWDGSAVASHTLAPVIPLAISGTWQFRARGQDGLGQLSNFQFQNVVVASTPPIFVTQPPSQTVNAGQTVSFNVAVNGSAPLSYQWRKNGSNISGATAATYTITNAQSGDAANAPGYSVVVTNGVGSAASAAATLTVNLVAPSITTQPASQAVNTGQTATFSVAAAGSTPLTYQWRKNSTNIGGATGATFSVSNAQTSDAAIYSVVVTNSVGAATSNGATLSVSTLQPIRLAVEYWQANDWPGREIGGALTLVLGDHGGGCYTQGEDTDGDGEDDNWYEVCEDPWYGYDWEWVAAYAEDGLYGSRWDTTAGTFDLGSVASGYSSATANRGYFLNSYQYGDLITFHLFGSAPSANCSNYTWALYHPAGYRIDGNWFNPSYACSFNAYALGTYRVEVTYLNASAAPSTATVSYYIPVGVSVPALPTIVLPPAPAAQTVPTGASVSYAVTAGGATSYQWWKDGAALSGATSPTLTLTNVQSAASGSYSVVVGNTAGSVTSNAVSLTVSAAVPAITSSLSAAGTTGTAFTYTITATNSPTSFSAGGLPAGLSLNTASGAISGTPTQTGAFNVALAATNAGGTSPAATLLLTIVNGAPTITSSLAASGTFGTAFSYTITATNSPTSFGASGLPGGAALNTATGAITGTPTQTGTFNVALTAANPGGSSPTATLVLTIASSATGDDGTPQLRVHRPL